MAKPSKYYALETSGRQASITIYGDVTSWPWFESDVSAYNLSKVLDGLDVDEIDVNINSYGGEVAEGLAIHNALKRHKAKVRTRVDGFACSIASVIFAAGDERIMNNASLLMIHNAWQCASGNAAELRKAADDLDKINDASVKAYMAVASVDESEIRALMDEESWIDPDQAVELGLATAIEGEESDKPSQNVRWKVMQMLKNPYQLTDDDPDDDPDDTDGTDDGTDGTDGETDGTDDQDGDDAGTGDEAGTDDDPDDPDDDPDAKKDDDTKCSQAFLRAIMGL